MLQNSQGSGAVYAALDLGTNNCRLLVATPVYEAGKADPVIQVYDSFSRIVRLGEGVSSTGVLSEDAMARTMSALAACKKKLDKYTLAGSRFVATEACRRASNGKEFLQQVREKLDIDIEIISTEEEAKLAFAGCSSLLLPKQQGALVFDIGGGSTELMWVDVEALERDPSADVIKDWLSVGFGVMNLADKFGGSVLSERAFEDMVVFLQEQIHAFEKSNGISEHIKTSHVQLLSTSGTVTTLAAVHLDLPRYDRARIDGITLPVADIRATVQKLLEMRPSGRFNHPCIGPDRADFILSGCAIFEAISSLWPAQNITIADRGVREGIILSLMRQGR